MNLEPPIVVRRRGRQRKHRSLELSLSQPAFAGALAYPGYADPEESGGTRNFLTGSLLLHALAFGTLLALARLVPVIQERIIPVQILKEETPPPPPPPETPASAPKALAQHRN